MKKQCNWKRMMGILLLGFVLVGCTVVAREGYKYYQSKTHNTIAMMMNIPASDVYADTITTINKQGITKITKRDDKKMTLSLDKNGQKGSVTVTDLGEKRSELKLVAEKLKDVDPSVQKKELESSLLAVCAQLKIECIPATEKK